MLTVSNSLYSEDTHTSLPGTCLLGYRGSVAHGMFIPKSDPNSIDDIDLMGVVIGEPQHYFGLSEWGTRGTRDFWEGHYDLVYYEIRKMFSLLLQGNPNVMSMLWMRPSEYLLVTPAGRQILDNRSMFVGKHVYNAFAGYAHQQLQKMETRDPAELREYMAVTAEMKYRGIHPNHKGETFPEPDKSSGEAKNVSVWGDEGLRMKLRSFQKKGENIGYMGDKRKSLVLEHGYDAKNAAHCVRLLRMCKEFLAAGEMSVYRTDDAHELLDIKRGKWKLEDVKTLADQLFSEIKTERDRSPLPEQPQREKAEALLVEIICNAVSR